MRKYTRSDMFLLCYEDSGCNLNINIFAMLSVIVSESLEDMKGVLAGGVVQGWTPDVAVGLWKRMLGILGGINKIEDAENHALVFEELSLLVENMNKVKQ